MLNLPTLNQLTEIKERPMLNSNYIQAPDLGAQRSMNLNELVYWVKRTPECIGILKRIATDIFTEASFVSIGNDSKGGPTKAYHKKNENRANSFWRKNHGRQKMLAGGFDWLMTGDAYIWKGKLSDAQVKETALRHYESYGIKINDIEYKSVFYDEDWNGLNSIEVVPSSMTRIIHDDFKIINYLQKSRMTTSNDRKFSTDEIVHMKFLEIDGKVYGFSPMESSYVTVKTINAIQDYGYNYFANGCKVGRAWLFSGNINPTSIDKFEENLKKFKNVTYAWSDIVLDGADKMDIKELNTVSEEMEFRKLAIHSVGRLAFAFNMPADILSSILGVDIKGTAGGSDIEDAGYNRNIVEAQKYWEDMLNSQLFIPEFKVEIRFERTFKQDQIRQIQYLSTALPVAEFFWKHEYPVTDEFYHDLLQIPRKYLKEGKIKKVIEELGTPFTPPTKPQAGANKQKYADSKKKQQQPQSNIQPAVGS